MTLAAASVSGSRRRCGRGSSQLSKQAARIKSRHLEILVAKRRGGELSERQLADLATMIQSNDAYYWKEERGEV